VLKLHPQTLTVEVGEYRTDAAGPKTDRMLFRFGGIEGCGVVEVACELVEGTFPPYDEVIPRSPCLFATVEVEALTAACSRAQKWSSAESRGMRLSIDLNKSAMEVSTRAPERGEWNRRLQLVGSRTLNGQAMDIGFNPAFIADILGNHRRRRGH